MHIFKTDWYEYKNLPYLKIHHPWPTHYLQFDSTHQTAAQAYQNLAERISSGTEQIHIYTDASKRSDTCLVAFHSPHLPNCLTQRNIHPNSSVLCAELTAIYLDLKQFQKLTPPSRELLIISNSQMAIQNITQPLYRRKVSRITIFIRNILQYLMHFTRTANQPSYGCLPTPESPDMRWLTV